MGKEMKPRYERRADPKRGIYLSAEKSPYKLWMVAMMLALIPKGEKYSEPILIEHSLN